MGAGVQGWHALQLQCHGCMCSVLGLRTFTTVSWDWRITVAIPCAGAGN